MTGIGADDHHARLVAQRAALADLSAGVHTCVDWVPRGDDVQWRSAAAHRYEARLRELRRGFRRAASELDLVLVALDSALAAGGSHG